MISNREEKQTPMSPSTMLEIKGILTDFLNQCDIKYPRNICLDPSYRAACYADATRRGFDMELLMKPLNVGIAIGDTAYRHLDNYSTRVFIAVWTALLTHIDDYYEVYSDGLKDFFHCFIHQKPQRYQVLDQIVTLLREIPQHWGTIPSNLTFTAGIDYLTSTILDSTIKGMEIQPYMAPAFPRFTRSLTGNPRSYAIMVFPADLDLKSWMQVVPDLENYINHVNDLLSFYKEEVAGEKLNFVSMSANSNGITKIEVLRKLANETAQCYQRGSQLLQQFPRAWEAFRAFSVGYVGFHALSTRYKLDQLGL